MAARTVPDYAGGSLVNLIAELEQRLTRTAPSPALHAPLAAEIPAGQSYVLVLFDGLGDRQLDHPAAAGLMAARRAAIDTVFPTTTTVALATVATGLPPIRHGLLGYQLWIPEVGEVVNTIKWTTLWGAPVEYDVDGLLPAPNLWERLVAAGREPITVQPGNFVATPLSRALYRGCRFEPVFSAQEVVAATCDLARHPGRLVMTYVPHVDFAAHVYGQEAPEYAEAVEFAASVWEAIAAGLPEGAVLVGAADHGHVDFPRERQVAIARADHRDRTFYGDGRAMFVRGEGAQLAARLPAEWVPRDGMDGWWGPGEPHPAFAGRAPDGVLLAEDDHLLLHKHSDTRMTGNHGALTAAELRVPLLVTAS